MARKPTPLEGKYLDAATYCNALKALPPHLAFLHLPLQKVMLLKGFVSFKESNNKALQKRVRQAAEQASTCDTASPTTAAACTDNCTTGAIKDSLSDPRKAQE